MTKTYCRKKKIEQEAEGIRVPGIIMDVCKRILRTDSVVVDGLLEKWEALGCYKQPQKITIQLY